MKMEKIPDNFDITIYLRYFPIVEKIKQIDKGEIEICEVGSGNYGIGPYLKKDFIGVDLDFGDRKSNHLNPIKSSATKLPSDWTDRFDVVLSVDVLEHLSPSQRNKAIKEMIRISNNYLILAFPTGFLAKISDWLLDRFYLLTHKKRLPFLKEHRQYPLPKVKDVKKIVKEEVSEVRIKTKSNTSFCLYLKLLFLGFSEVGILTRLFKLSYYLRGFLRHINLFPYRKILFIKLNEDDK